MKFRTKKTVSEGVMKHHEDVGTELFDYQPGNGTRYPVLFTNLSYSQCALLGYGDNCVMVTVQRFSLDRFISKPFYTDGRPLFVREVQEAFDMNNVNDACCLTEFLGEQLGSPTDADEVAAQFAA